MNAVADMTETLDTEFALQIIREEVPKIMRRLQELRDLPSNSPNLWAHFNKVIYEMIGLEEQLGLRRYDQEAALIIERDIRGRVMSVKRRVVPDIDLSDYE